jgi:hypothetical protein
MVSTSIEKGGGREMIRPPALKSKMDGIFVLEPVAFRTSACNLI